MKDWRDAMKKDACKHCGACDKCDRCSHCGHCKNCGKYVALPWYPVIYPVYPHYQPIWIQPCTPHPYYPTWSQQSTITWGNSGNYTLTS